MKQPILRRYHGVADYNYAILAALMPILARFSNDPVPAHLAYGLGALVIVHALLTRAEWGLIKIIPFRVHLGVDAIVSAGVLLAPWIFGFTADGAARDTFIVLGLIGIVVTALTRPQNYTAAHADGRKPRSWW